MGKFIFLCTLSMLIITYAYQVYAGDGDLVIDGKLGVGTTNPDTKLDVNGEIKLSPPVSNLRDANGETYMSFGAATNGADNQFVLIGSLGAATGNKTGYFGIATNNRERVRVDNAGNVGIGTVTPTPYLSGTYGISLYHQQWPGITLGTRWRRSNLRP